ncbi:MAG: DNA-binding NarL/FixJ family response regulator [bacterium]|jgi:DNA-binding NarL/FixJ family response regulator
MTQELKILMVDDHPMIIEGYQNTLLATKKENQELTIDIAHDCERANKLMRSSVNSGPYNILFFDISLPASRDGQITSGEYLPNAKVIILTMFNESYRILNIIKENPLCI